MDTEMLAGLRVLVVEDEMLVSLLIEDVLTRLHCVVVGPFDTVPGALAAAASEPIDLAVLDVNLAGVQAFPVAETLAARRIPFLFLSGYGRSVMPRNHPDWVVCSKPFHEAELIRMMAEQVST
jgi:CheY-like chemotaxis protein